MDEDIELYKQHLNKRLEYVRRDTTLQYLTDNISDTYKLHTRMVEMMEKINSIKSLDEYLETLKLVEDLLVLHAILKRK